MKRYIKYKQSGYSWFGEIPSHWEVKDLKHVLKFQTGGTPSTKESKYYDGNNTWITIRDMVGKVVSQSSQLITREGIEGANIPLTPKGSLLYSFKLSVGQVAFTGKDLYTNEAIASFLPSKKYDIKYWYYALPYTLIHNANENIYGAKLLNQELIKNAVMIVPPKEEQQFIVGFLDYKTGQIDNFISYRQKQIKLLKEQKAVIINKAVTKGINPDAKMKPSWIEWIGEIPEGWKMVKLKYCLKSMVGGGTPSKENPGYWNGEIRWISPKDMKTDLIEKTQDYITAKGLKESSTILIKEPSILIVVRSGILKHTLPIAINAGQVTLNQDLKALVPNKQFLIDYMFDLFRGLSDVILLNCSKVVATVDSIETDDLLNFLFPVPPIEEQTAIIDYIKREASIINNLIDKYQQQINLIEEYRKSLISHAVTGKIDLREYQSNKRRK